MKMSKLKNITKEYGFLVCLIVCNFILFCWNFYTGIISSDILYFTMASAGMLAILFCVWVMGYKYSVEKFRRRTPTRQVSAPKMSVPRFISINPVPIKKSDINRFVTKKVEKTKREEWKEYQEKNK